MIELKEFDFSVIPDLFKFHQEPEANQMAAFIRDDYKDYNLFFKRWEQITKNEENTLNLIYCDKTLVGYICAYKLFNEINVGYWLGKEFWGRGIASFALKLFISKFKNKTLFARVAFDNIASIRVLEKCGFSLISEELFYSNFRKIKIKELVYKFNT